MVTAWRNREKRKPPRWWPLGHVAVQVGTTHRAQVHPLGDLFTLTVIHTNLHTHTSQLKSGLRCKIIGGEVLRIPDFLVTVPCHTRFRAPDRASLGPFFFDFYAVNYQPDCTKVVLLYTSFNFVIRILTICSMDQAQNGSKVRLTPLSV
jgi:hypothetical protein